MTQWLAPFELRKVLIKWTRQIAGGTNEDVAITTIHYLKLTGGAPDSNWSAADYAAEEASLDTWWNGLKGQYLASTVLSEYRWYKSGPVWEPIGQAPTNPADRITARAVAGTNGASVGLLPPQCAVTITKLTEVRKRWGRMYLPPPAVNTGNTTLTADGRLSAQLLNVYGPFTVSAYNRARAANRIPVVWSRGNDAYVTPKGTSIPAHAATAYSVVSLQVDNLWDVQRSRRYRAPTVRQLTILT